MKQITLNPNFPGPDAALYSAGDAAEGGCLAGLVMRWAFFGLVMWWIWSSFGSHGFAWLAGIAIGFALARRELCA
jgi:hypothetical protein